MLSPMAFQRALAGACPVPQPYRAVSAAGRKPAVGRKRHTSDDMAAKLLEKIALTYLLVQRLLPIPVTLLDWYKDFCRYQ